MVTATAQPQQMSKPQIYMENFCIYLIAQGQHSPHDIRGETLESGPVNFLRLEALSSCMTLSQWKYSFFMFLEREPDKKKP